MMSHPLTGHDISAWQHSRWRATRHRCFFSASQPDLASSEEKAVLVACAVRADNMFSRPCLHDFVLMFNELSEVSGGEQLRWRPAHRERQFACKPPGQREVGSVGE